MEREFFMKSTILSAIAVFFLVNHAFAFIINGLEDSEGKFAYVLNLNNNCSAVATDKDPRKIITSRHCVAQYCGKRNIHSKQESAHQKITRELKLLKENRVEFDKLYPQLTRFKDFKEVEFRLHIINDYAESHVFYIENQSFEIKNVFCKRDEKKDFINLIEQLKALQQKGQESFFEVQKKYSEYYNLYQIENYNQRNAEKKFPYFLDDYSMNAVDHDLAVIELESAHSFPTIEIANEEPKTNDEVTIIGYGLTSIMYNTNSGSHKRKRYYGQNLYWKNPLDKTITFTGASENDRFRFLFYQEGNGERVSMAPGDSGGAVISNQKLICINQSIETTLDKNGDMTSRCTNLLTKSNQVFLRELSLID